MKPNNCLRAAAFALCAAIAHATDHRADVHYESSLVNYQSYRHVEASDWPQKNETVRLKGGWRAYAREAAAHEPSESIKPVMDVEETQENAHQHHEHHHHEDDES
jgi:hypothetical protein